MLTQKDTPTGTPAQKAVVSQKTPKGFKVKTNVKAGRGGRSNDP